MIGSKLNWLIVRPGRLTDDPGVGRIPAAQTSEYGSVSRNDIAEFIARALHEPRLRESFAADEEFVDTVVSGSPPVGGEVAEFESVAAGSGTEGHDDMGDVGVVLLDGGPGGFDGSDEGAAAGAGHDRVPFFLGAGLLAAVAAELVHGVGGHEVVADRCQLCVTVVGWWGGEVVGGGAVGVVPVGVEVDGGAAGVGVGAALVCPVKNAAVGVIVVLAGADVLDGGGDEGGADPGEGGEVAERVAGLGSVAGGHSRCPL